jgi:hypothetical protein
MTSEQSIRLRIRKLGAADYQGPAIIAPVIHLMGSQIEAIEADEFLYNPTKLAKGLSELRIALGSNVITCASSAAMEAEAFGADIDWSTYPPRVTSAIDPSMVETDDPTNLLLLGERIEAAVECTKRLSSTEGSNVALCAAITSPGKLASELTAYDFNNQDEIYKNKLLDFSGRCVTGITRKLCESGINLMIFQELDIFDPVIDFEAWKSAFIPICNMARFHRVKIVLVLENNSLENINKIAEVLPMDVSLCLNKSSWLSSSDKKPHGLVLEKNYQEWSELPESVSFVTTGSEISVDADIGELTQAINKLTRNVEA